MRDVGAWEVWCVGMKLLVSKCELSRFVGTPLMTFHTSMMRLDSSQGCQKFPPQRYGSKIYSPPFSKQILDREIGFHSILVTKVKIWQPGNISASNSCCVEMRFFYHPSAYLTRHENSGVRKDHFHGQDCFGKSFI